MFDRTAAAIVTMKGRGIEKPQDVMGKNLGGASGRDELDLHLLLPPGDTPRLCVYGMSAPGFAGAFGCVLDAPPRRRPQRVISRLI